jgi:hypothetical protein
VHQTVVPFPGGLTVPVFCVPALGASISFTQVGCGIGEIDSDGGSDFTVTENGDTSYNLNGCNVPQKLCPSLGPAPDSSGAIDITVGDGVADTCASGGTANAIVSIPVNTQTWMAADSSCPDTDGMYNPGADTLLESSRRRSTSPPTRTRRSSWTSWGRLRAIGRRSTGTSPAPANASTWWAIRSTSGPGTVFSSGSRTTTFHHRANATFSARPPLAPHLQRRR